MLTIVAVTIAVSHNVNDSSASNTEDTKTENMKRFISIGQNYEKIHIQMQKTNDAVTRAHLESLLQSLIAEANELGVPTRAQQAEDPNAWPMEIFIQDQSPITEAKTTSTKIQVLETNLVSLKTIETNNIYNACCDSVHGLAGWHYTCWIIFTCDGYLNPTSWQALYTSFVQEYDGENSGFLHDVVPFMKIKNTGTSAKIIEGSYSIYESSPEWTGTITMHLPSPNSGSIYTVDYPYYGSLPVDTTMDSVLARTQ